MKGMREKYRNDHYLHLHRNFKGNLILGNYYSTDSFRNNTTTYSVLMYPDVKLNNLSFTNVRFKFNQKVCFISMIELKAIGVSMFLYR